MNEADLLIGAFVVVSLTVLLSLGAPNTPSADAPTAAAGPCITEPDHAL